MTPSRPTPAADALAHARQIAAEIVAAAQADARRVLQTAHASATTRESDLVGRIESICGAAREDSGLAMRQAREHAASTRASAEETATQIREHARHEVNRIRAQARRDTSELDRRASRRRRQLESEVRELVKARDAASNEFTSAIVALHSAAELIALVQQQGGAAKFNARVRPERAQRVARRTALVLAPVAVVVALGYVLFTSTPAHALFHDNIRPAPLAIPAKAPLCPVPTTYRAAFRSAAKEEEVPQSLLVAVATVESRFNANAHSTAGAVGLLQLLPSTAGDLQVDPTSPKSNILGGATYLRQMLDRFGNTDVALAAYNAGPNAVGRGEIPAATLQYVGEVMQTWSAIKGCR